MCVTTNLVATVVVALLFCGFVRGDVPGCFADTSFMTLRFEVASILEQYQHFAAVVYNTSSFLNALRYGVGLRLLDDIVSYVRLGEEEIVGELEKSLPPLSVDDDVALLFPSHTAAETKVSLRQEVQKWLSDFSDAPNVDGMWIFSAASQWQFSIGLHDADSRDQSLHTILLDFEEKFALPTEMSVYFIPPGTASLRTNSLHRDRSLSGIFLLQISGVTQLLSPSNVQEGGFVTPAGDARSNVTSLRPGEMFYLPSTNRNFVSVPIASTEPSLFACISFVTHPSYTVAALIAQFLQRNSLRSVQEPDVAGLHDEFTSYIGDVSSCVTLEGLLQLVAHTLGNARAMNSWRRAISLPYRCSETSGFINDCCRSYRRRIVNALVAADSAFRLFVEADDAKQWKQLLSDRVFTESFLIENAGIWFSVHECNEHIGGIVEFVVKQLRWKLLQRESTGREHVHNLRAAVLWALRSLRKEVEGEAAPSVDAWARTLHQSELANRRSFDLWRKVNLKSVAGQRRKRRSIFSG